MSAHIHWEFVELRDKQIEKQKLDRAAEVISLALDGAPPSYYPTFGGDPDLIFYVSPSPFLDLPSDTEPA